VETNFGAKSFNYLHLSHWHSETDRNIGMAMEDLMVLMIVLHDV